MESKLPTYSGLKNYLDTSTDFGYQSYVGWEHTSHMDNNLKFLYSTESFIKFTKNNYKIS